MSFRSPLTVMQKKPSRKTAAGITEFGGHIINKLIYRILQRLSLLIVLLSLISTAVADTTTSLYQFNIPRQTADGALTTLGQQANITVLYRYELVKGRVTNALQGEYTLPQAVSILLEQSGLSAEFNSAGHLIITLAERIDGDYEMNTKKNILASTIAFFIGGSSLGAVAQEGESPSDGFMLEEIIVTAQKREQNVQDVAISIAVLGGDELDARGLENLVDIANSVPGMFVFDNGGVGGRIVTLRGIGNVFGSSSLVGVYLDEAVAVGVPGFGQLDLRIHDLERVEVLKGPQGTLYGQGSMGGTIRYVTRKPVLDAFGAVSYTHLTLPTKRIV